MNNLKFDVDPLNRTEEDVQKELQYYAKMKEQMEAAQAAKEPMLFVSPDGNMLCGQEVEIVALFLSALSGCTPMTQRIVKMGIMLGVGQKQKYTGR